MMESTDKKDVANRAYRFMVPYTDTVDMAKKILMMYNGYLMAIGMDRKIVYQRHLNLMSYYFVFGYSLETKKKYSHCFNTELRYIAVLDTEMKKRSLLIDRNGDFRTRSLCDDIENMRRLFILEGSRDMGALVSLFYRSNSLKNE